MGFFNYNGVVYVLELIMPGGRRGLVAPQNTFLENIIRRSSQQRKYNVKYQLGVYWRLKCSI